MAINDQTLTDEDLDYSDWIEIENTSGSPVDLGGWYLTDDSADLTKWQFPTTTIDSGSFLVVFASDKNRALAGTELHTNFKLAGSGEYLALVQADGTTIADEFSPEYPSQIEDISYGMGSDGTEITIIGDEAACSVRVPTDSSEGSGWQLAGFDDTSWQQGTTGVGYDTDSTYTSLINTDLETDMFSENATAYIRIPFTLSSLPNLLSFTLRMKYDDGFVAYLNGVQVASANAPLSPEWDAAADGFHNDPLAVVFEDFDISAFDDELVAGQNVLAIHALNQATGSSDMLIVTELNGTISSGGTSMGYLATPTPGSANSNISSAASEAVEISIPGAVCSGLVSVELFATNSAQAIYYTLDGSEPSMSSSPYSGAITISSTTILRARSYEPGFALGPINSETYVFLNNDVKSFSSDLPIVVVDNLGAGTTIPTTHDGVPAQGAFLAFFEPGADGRTSLTNTFSIGSRAGILRRGQTSLRSTDQKPNLAIESWGRGENDDAKIAPFDMPAESDWILWAPYHFDRSGLRNAFIYELSNQTGNYAVRTHFVEVFLNVSGDDVSMDDYAGLYVFMEKIKVDNDRVDIDTMTPLDNQAPNVTGGYMLAFDKDGDTEIYGTAQDATPWGLYINEPSATDLTSAQSNYIKNYILDFEAQIDNSDPVTGYPSYIDVDAFVDHNLLNMLAKNVDGLRLSTHMSKDRNGKLALGPIWDFDRSMNSSDSRDNNPEDWTDGGDATRYIEDYQTVWWTPLFTSADFSQAYIDHWQAYRQTVFSDSNVVAVIDGMAAEIAEARVRDIAKWNQNPRYGNDGLDGTQQGEVNHMKWFLTTRMAWVDNQFLASPILSQNSGPISDPISLTLSAPSGHPIYYTLDGSDPRASGGTLAPSAILYTNAISVPPDRIVMARVWDGSVWGPDSALPDDVPWSGLTQAVFYRADPTLRLTEVQYNPETPTAPSLYTSDEFEFVELQNIGTEPLDLREYALDGGIDFSFRGSDVELLPAGAYVVVVRNRAAFSSVYNTNGMHIAGEYTGMLSNGGENIRLEFHNQKLFDISYNDARGWPVAADGGGPSLIPINDSVNAQGFDILDCSENWRASTYIGGSPGQADPEIPPEILINEVTAHTDTGLNPPFDSNDQIELYNQTTGPVTLDGFWFLSDNVKDPEKNNIPAGTIIPAGGWVVFDEDDFHPDRTDGFGLDKMGELVVLSHRPDGVFNRVVDSVAFKGQANGASWGRFPDGNAYWQTLEPTANAANQLPDSGIRIQELMYHPAPMVGHDVEAELEYIMLTNRASQSVDLSSQEVSQTWRVSGGVAYQFAPGISMAGGESVWLVPFDPMLEPTKKTFFCTTYNLDASSVRLFGPYSGELSNSGERIALERPQGSDDPLLPDDLSWIIVDEVSWMDEAPWPAGADGSGLPIHRIGSAGTDPQGWATDGDHDGLPDDWENQYFPAGVAALPSGNADGDLHSNLEEYIAGTNPTNTGSSFHIENAAMENGFVIQWPAIADRVYSVYWAETLTNTFEILENNIELPRNRHTDLLHDAQPAGFYKVQIDLK